MRLKTVKIKNFRSYNDQVEIEIDDLVAFVGKNDIGKSTVLEALDIFFNDGKGVIKLDKDDINKQALDSGDEETVISVCFEEFPDEVVIDESNRTRLPNEYLLNSANQLEVIKKYVKAGREKVFVKAYHPTNTNCNDLLHKKNNELKAIIKAHSIKCDNQSINAKMRTAIWEHFSSDLQLSEVEIDITKEDAKAIWSKLQTYLPLYSLFQSDRKNSDGDSEVQDPLKEAVKQIISDEDLQEKFGIIAKQVEEHLNQVAHRTLEKIREMNPEIANSLEPQIPTRESLKWADVFKSVSIVGDQGIPINKRGSGVKRLVLLNFFRAEAERRRENTPERGRSISSIIYAIEEPETSQHIEHQKMLINAFLELSKTANTQVIITTHSAALVKELDFVHLRLVRSSGTTKTIEKVVPNCLPYPSLNEVNFTAFSEITEEYHNELYGYIESQTGMDNFKDDKATMPYKRLKKNGQTVDENVNLTDYIRHQIHHPENKHNTRYTSSQLRESIDLMREFIVRMRSIEVSD